MISAEEALKETSKNKEKQDQEYSASFPLVYEITKNKLEADIKVQIKNLKTHATIIVHDLKIADVLKQECENIGYKVTFLPKSRTFTVKW